MPINDVFKESAHEVSDRILRDREARVKSILVVEGSGDKTTLMPLLPGVSIFPAHTRKSVIEVGRDLLVYNQTQFACLIDQDFDENIVANNHVLGNRLITYEGRDLECMLIDLGALDKLINAYGDRSKIDSLGGAYRVRNDLLTAVNPISRLRKANAIHQWGLPFNKIHDLPNRFRIGDKPPVLKPGYCEHLLELWDAEPPAKPPLLDQMHAVMENEELLKPRGKDVLAVTSLALRKWIGNQGSRAPDEETLMKLLQSYGELVFRETSWLQHIKTTVDT